jgi:dynein heavy chain
MYGGHIVNNWDRVMCAAMLNSLMTDGLLEDIELFPFIEGKPVTFKSPP